MNKNRFLLNLQSASHGILLLEYVVALIYNWKLQLYSKNNKIQVINKIDITPEYEFEKKAYEDVWLFRTDLVLDLDQGRNTAELKRIIRSDSAYFSRLLDEGIEHIIQNFDRNFKETGIYEDIRRVKYVFLKDIFIGLNVRMFHPREADELRRILRNISLVTIGIQKAEQIAEERYKTKTADSVVLIIPSSLNVSTLDEVLKHLQTWRNHLLAFGRLTKINEKPQLISLEQGSVVAVLGVRVLVAFAILLVVDKGLDIIKKIYEIQKLSKESRKLDLGDISNKLLEKARNLPEEATPAIVEELFERFPYKDDDKNEVKNSLSLAVRYILSFLLVSGKIEFNLLEEGHVDEEKVDAYQDKVNSISELKDEIMSFETGKAYEKILAESLTDFKEKEK